MTRILGLIGIVFAFLSTASFSELPPGVVNTQPNGDTPPAPAESLSKIKVPDGFHVTLFAGEPDVYQPIAMEFDDRGRLWVAECFSYPDWQAKDRDRVLIFTDRDNDGEFDDRQVFANNLSNVTGFTLGFGGVWVCSTPNLIYIPDRNRDDQPDGPAEIKLDGWNDESDDIEHNVFNGMTWGPDGWMYGSHGILADSFVGKPGTPQAERQQLNCGIWRYHPVSGDFQVVAHGTTNPWGIDFDDYGQGFFTNCVIGHLWHLIPGARYERMYGTHFNPFTYTRIDACSDHLHWGGGSWQDSRGGKGMHSDAGGGHAHVGAMVYRGGTWPDKYHGSMFTANLHGNRLNRDTLHRQGSGYVARHAPDFFLGNDPWLRGIAVKYGPDGNVFVSDWTDLGECHDSDGTHRSSGRIYKIVYGDKQPLPAFDLAQLPNAGLMKLAHHRNAWYWNQARRLLHERTTAGEDMSEVNKIAFRTLAKADLSTSLRLKMLHILALTGGADRQLVNNMLASSDEHAQAWAVRQLVETKNLDEDALEDLIHWSQRGTPRLQLEIASALQHVDLQDRWIVAAMLMQHLPDKDPNLLPMIWFVVEPLVEQDRQQFIHLLHVGQKAAHLSVLRQFIAQRYVTAAPADRGHLELAFRVALQLDDAAKQDAVLGILAGLESERRVPMPSSWSNIRNSLGNNANVNVQLRAALNELAIKFQDQTTMKQLASLARERSAPAHQRIQAIQLLSRNKVQGTAALLLATLSDPAIRKDVIVAMREFNDPRMHRRLLGELSRYSSEEQEAAVTTLAQSRSAARQLLNAIARNQIPPEIIQPTQALAIYQLRDTELRNLLKQHWGDLRSSSRESRQKIANWKAELSPKVLAKADLQNGARIYAQNCGKCHKLFGHGGDIGPDLTGSDRRNLDYILQNVITPSAVVGKDYRMHTLVLSDGRTVSGSLREQTEQFVVVQTTENKITIPRADIEEIAASDLSLMPAGQFDTLSKDAVRDLVGYLARDAE